ncbi:LuxR family transcriptional regulator [Amycolatopsis sp. AA4]|uniref:response regulator transcription factor n=1 Tax=Actinomycetes TaxID=1760 RepID=UPI0001B5409B|nr:MULTISPECIES: helix-turn-helix transcriptional regulator [Actinomycetes]ATY13973.1 LuxR family transcriptional regulator [Amycolatopsis sp. AA4]
MTEPANPRGTVFIGADRDAITVARGYLESRGIELTAVTRSTSVLQIFVNSDAIAGARTQADSITDSSLLQLQMIAWGMTNAEISKQLGKSENTVKSNLRNLFRLIGARDRAHAVLIGCRAGLI